MPLRNSPIEKAPDPQLHSSGKSLEFNSMRNLPLPDSFTVPDQDCYNNRCIVLIAYEDVAAGQRAMCLVDHLDQQGEGVRFQPQPWRFDLLVDPDWAQFAAGDALKADLLVISTSKQSGLPQAIQNWLTGCLARKRGTQAAVVALFEGEGHLDTDSSALQFVESAAKQAGLEFFAPLTARQYATPEVRLGEVAVSAPPQAFNQVTPSSHWGINE